MTTNGVPTGKDQHSAIRVVLITFGDCWKRQAWAEMVAAVQQSEVLRWEREQAAWASAVVTSDEEPTKERPPSTAERLRAFFGAKELTLFRIIQTRLQTEVMVEATVEVEYFMPDLERSFNATIRVNVIREDYEGHPVAWPAGGSWGFNPTSALRESKRREIISKRVNTR